jgi:hypothetical protein
MDSLQLAAGSLLSDKREKTSGKNVIDLLGDNHYNFERTKRRYECL